VQTTPEKILAIPKGWRRVLLLLAAMILFVVITPAAEAVYVGLVNPSTTGPMVVRRLRSIAYGLRKPRSQLEWRTLDKVAPDFLKTVWLAEDGKFFRHGGFDWEQIGRSQREAVRTGRPARGASTITQQCARSLFLWQGRSWTRKVLEAYYTVWMELFLSKKRIFELYVNVIELGDGVYGIEAASQYHFHRSASEITREEAAALVTIMPLPQRLDPCRLNDSMLQRRDVLLKRAEHVRFPIR
jgi:monofunctional biosynthetic peptidoglycan transglycosylase